MDEGGRPDYMVNKVVAAGNTAPVRGNRAGDVRDIDGDKGVGVVPPQQAKNTGGKAHGNVPFMGTINPIFGLVLPIKGNFLYKVHIFCPQ